MEKDSALYQLMGTCMNGVMNGIVSGDGEYQAILRESDIYSGELDRMDLSKEIRLLIDRCPPACLPAWVFQLQSQVFGEMPADRSKRNDRRTVTAKCRTGRKGRTTAPPPLSDPIARNDYKHKRQAPCKHIPLIPRFPAGRTPLWRFVIAAVFFCVFSVDTLLLLQSGKQH